MFTKTLTMLCRQQQKRCRLQESLCIWHDGSLLKLLRNKIRGNFYDLNKNPAFKMRRQTITYRYSKGVGQGCIFSPPLLSIYLYLLLKNSLIIHEENTKEMNV
jgi:hypothetical protein